MDIRIYLKDILEDFMDILKVGHPYNILEYSLLSGVIRHITLTADISKHPTDILEISGKSDV